MSIIIRVDMPVIGIGALDKNIMPAIGSINNLGGQFYEKHAF